MTVQTVKLDEKVKIPEEVVFQKVGDETVLLNLQTGTYFGLDTVGTRVWELVAEKGTLAGIVESMLEDYEVTPEDLQRDILRLVKELRAKGLVQVGG